MSHKKSMIESKSKKGGLTMNKLASASLFWLNYVIVWLGIVIPPIIAYTQHRDLFLLGAISGASLAALVLFIMHIQFFAKKYDTAKKEGKPISLLDIGG